MCGSGSPPRTADASHQALRVLVLGVGCKRKTGKRVHLIDDARGLFGGAHHIPETFQRPYRVSVCPRTPSNEHDLLLHIIERGLQFRAVEAGNSSPRSHFLTE